MLDVLRAFENEMVNTSVSLYYSLEFNSKWSETCSCSSSEMVMMSSLNHWGKVQTLTESIIPVKAK